MIVINGDLNARSPLFWSGESCKNEAGKALFEFCLSKGFEQLIDEPTHLPNENIETCIDLLLVNNCSLIIDSGVIPSPDPMCKHQIVKGKINMHVPPHQSIKEKFGSIIRQIVLT